MSRLRGSFLPCLVGQRHGGGVAAGDVRDTGRFTLELPQALWFPVRAIDNPRASLAPAVVRDVVLRKAKADMIAVVSHLVVKLVGRGGV